MIYDGKTTTRRDLENRLILCHDAMADAIRNEQPDVYRLFRVEAARLELALEIAI